MLSLLSLLLVVCGFAVGCACLLLVVCVASCLFLVVCCSFYVVVCCCLLLLLCVCVFVGLLLPLPFVVVCEALIGCWRFSPVGYYCCGSLLLFSVCRCRC